MQASANYKINRVIKNKEYFVPEDDHPIRKQLEYGLSECTFKTELQDAKVEVMSVYPNISKTVVARVVRCNNHSKLFSGYDYIVEVSGDIWDVLTDEVKEIVMLHECEHMIVTYDKNGNASFRLRDHDLKDFRSIVAKYGLDWLNTLQDQCAEVRDDDDVEVKI